MRSEGALQPGALPHALHRHPQALHTARHIPGLATALAPQALAGQC